MKGDLLLALPERTATAPSGSARGFDQARSSMPGCRSCARRSGCTGHSRQTSRELLRGVHAIITEGFTTPDMSDAASLLGVK